MKTPWPTKKLGEICEERKEKNIYNENLPVFTVSHIYGLVSYQNIFYKQVHSKDTKNYKIVNRYDFAFGLPTKDTLPYGILENEEKVLISPAYIVFSIKDKNLLFPRFLYYLLKTNYYKWKIIEIAKSQSATRHGLPLKFYYLANLEIPLPPLPIQQKIVKVLDTIQEAVEIQEKIIEKTKELKKSLMAELFKYGAPSFRKGRKLKKTEITEIGEIPEDWEVVRLGNNKLFEIKLGGTPKTSVNEYWNGEIPWITPNDLNKLTMSYIEDTQRKISALGLKAGSTLLSENSIILSTRAPIGYIAVLKKPMAFNQGCKGIVIKDKSVISLFVYYFLLLKAKLLQELGTGSTFRELATSDLENFKLPLPLLPEQQEIVEILQTIDQKIEIEKKKKELYEELFKTMLNKIMNQEIDVEKIEI
jgi:type I restriction enzyme S subunit